MSRVSRRAFLLLAAQCVTSAIVGFPDLSYAARIPRQALSFYHTHTGETLEVVLDPKNISTRDARRVSHFLRDFRNGETHPIDRHLLALLCRIRKESGSDGTIEVISGYRSPATNAILRKKSSGVAKNSLHMQGRAIDIRLSNLQTSELKDIACSLKQGGVGYYAKSDFVHLDTGRIRFW
ncbi:MAG: DUF882 domain-containing protein [Desulfofustis sp.]|nr:DUF882 domain-containing protein [Desulfofustis sp.]